MEANPLNLQEIGKPSVFNPGTQEGFWRTKTSYEAIESAVVRMRDLADREGTITIAVPRIGIGYGDLS